MFKKHDNSSGSQVKTWGAGNYNVNDFESDELETMCDFAIAHRAKWKTRCRKTSFGPVHESRGAGRAKSKAEYPTLVAALAARSRMARKRGKRFRRLRPYRIGSSWLLTSMSKGQVRNFPVRPR